MSGLGLEGRIALVTGASRGIGRAIAIELAARGATVVVNYRSSAEAAEAVVAYITEQGGTARTWQADVSSFEAAGDLVNGVIDEYGQLDILVNNAGITRDNVIMMMKEDDWDAVLETNLKSAFNCTKAAIRKMMRKRYGRIVNISSVAGLAGNAGQANYSASKAGLIGFTKAVAREIAPRGVTVNAVAPGFVETDMTSDLPENIKEVALGQIPLGRWGSPEDIAHAVAFLASDEAAYITGQVLSVDGGMVMS